MSEELVDLNVRYVKEVDEPSIPEDIKALELLQMAYRGKVKLSAQQARCAIEALAYENPKVSAVAISHMTGNSFAEAA